MTVRHLAYYSVALIMLFVAVPLPAQEFPLAVGSETTFCGGAVFGGLNGLVTIQGVVGNPNRITAQLVGEGGQLVGSWIDLAADGIMPGAIPAFDGTLNRARLPVCCVRPRQLSDYVDAAVERFIDGEVLQHFRGPGGRTV